MAGDLDLSVADGQGLTDPMRVVPLTRAFDVKVRPPGSKSITNRALLLAALARGTSVLKGALVDADDAKRMIGAVRELGACVEIDADEVRVEGVNGRWRAGGPTRLDLNNAGTATRFLTAAAAVADAPVTIDGNERMRERPIGELGKVLAELGVEVRYEQREGYPPVTIVPGHLDELRTDLAMGQTESGQFISAMLMLGAAMPKGLTLTLLAEPTSASYIQMTLEMLSRVGASVRTSADMRVIRVGPAPGGREERGPLSFDGFTMEIEPDASGATYFWAAAALVKNARCEIEGLGDSPMQGDAGFVDVLARMGVGVRPANDEEGLVCEGSGQIVPVLADMSQMPDAAVTLAVVCAFAKGSSVLRGVRTLRVKECDRIAALQAELAKIGVSVEADAAGDADAMTIVPPAGGVDCSEDASRVEFETYDDHRMAMALALVGLRRPNVWIKDPGCVGKTYPGYWRELDRLRANPRLKSTRKPETL